MNGSPVGPVQQGPRRVRRALTRGLLVTPPLFLLDPPCPTVTRSSWTGDEGRHAATVMRIRRRRDRAGRRRSRVRARKGRSSRSDRVAWSSPSPCAERNRPADPRVIVVQALPKGDRGELAVELLTELGVDEIVPWQAARCVTVWSGARGDRAVAKWRRTAREAAKQSRRAWVPTVVRANGYGGRRRAAHRRVRRAGAARTSDEPVRRFHPAGEPANLSSSSVPKAGSPTVSSPSSTAPRRFASGSTYCAPRPPGRPRWPLSRPGSDAGFERGSRFS